MIGLPINDFKTRILIEKGWSDDIKYCVITPEGKKYLLRISKIEQKERKKVEFEMMQHVEELGVPMCKPIEFGTCDEGVYLLQGGSKERILGKFLQL
jgi:aminoglycoside phosphotransferase (APT) family kinase protein